MSKVNRRNWRSGMDLMSKFTTATVFLSVFHTTIHLFYIFFVLHAPNSIEIANYRFLGLNCLDLMSICTACMVLWGLCNIPLIIKCKRKLLPTISLTILVIGSFGSLYYTIMLHRFDSAFRGWAVEIIADVNNRLENLGPRDGWLKSDLKEARRDLQGALGQEVTPIVPEPVRQAKDGEEIW